MFKIYSIIFSLLSFLVLSACMQTFKVECGTYEGNNLNATWNTLFKQAAIVRNGYKEKYETTSTPYVTQYWNGYSYSSQTKYHYNTITKQIPINMDYEKKILQQYLNSYENAYSSAKITQESCQKQGLGTFVLKHDLVTNNINSIKMLIN